MKKRLIIMIILTITLISIVSLGSYALFTSKQEQGSNNTLTTNNCLNITFQNETNALNLTNEYPKTDEKGLNGKTYIFKINNTCNNYLAVNIKLNVDATLTTLPTNKIKIAVNKKYDEPNIKLLANFSNTDNIYTLINDGINPNSSNTYEYRMWVDYTADETVSNLTFKSQIEVEGILTKQEPHGWSNAQNGTLLYAIRNKYQVTTPETTPGSSISGENEKVLASTPDDYGTSYYFRGNVTNNYVLFAGKCWRIVRMDGNGNIKLFLWNNANTCTSSSNAYDKIAFNPSSQLDEQGNTVYNYATGVGFMYGHSVPTGETDNEKYLDAQANITDSYILNRLKTWYTDTFDTQALQETLADVIWCGDKSLYSGVGYGQTTSYFGAYRRLTGTKVPTMVCPNAGSDGKLSKYTASDTNKGNGALNGYKIGLLTADEVAFAGGVYNVDNTSYYLRTGSAYWTLSPCYFNASNAYARVWRVGTSGNLDYYGVSNGYGVRPAVSIKSTASLTDTVGQDGTVNHPYEIS